MIYRAGGGGDGSDGGVGVEADSKTRWAFDEIVGEIQNDKSLSVCLDRRGCSAILSPSITSDTTHYTKVITLHCWRAERMVVYLRQSKIHTRHRLWRMECKFENILG